MLILLALACKPATIGDDSAPVADDSSPVVDDSGDPVDWPRLFINEFMASNESTLADEGGAFPDWVELYNPNAEAVDLSGWTISDDLTDPGKHALEGVSVPAGGWLVLFADDDEEEGPNHLAFKLSASGEQLGLYDPSGGAVDEVSFGEQTTDHSAARTTDGGDTWEITDSPTPGASNGA